MHTDRQIVKVAVPLGVAFVAIVGLIFTRPAPGWAQDRQGEKKKPRAYVPTDEYTVRDIEGWKVYVNPQLIEQKELHDATVREVELQLYRVRRRLPARAVKKLREIPIWVEKKQHFPICLCYHIKGGGWPGRNGLNPDKEGGVDMGDAQTFVDSAIDQPWMILHELTHGYHDQFATRDQRKAIRAAYRRAKAAGIYDRVLRINGSLVRAYARNNDGEYFAETTEAFFGCNDYFPFVRPELKQHDPHMYKVLKTIWEMGPSDQQVWKHPSLPDPLPWDLPKLTVTPDVEWLDGTSPVRSLVYEGLPMDGKPTRVFAYYATPGTMNDSADTDLQLPGIVLVHGGGGTAFKEWVRLWAERGYAAIAMDLAGRGADRKRLPDGGPDQTDEVKFGAIDAPLDQQWPYHAVANVIRAHSLLRSFGEVDERRTAITGISWGGYLTCIAAGIDRRFQAAVPVYGCGFLDEGSAWLPRFEKMSEQQRQRWADLWDPSRYVGSARMPVFFVNGTNDGAYWLSSHDKTCRLLKPGRRNLRITVGMPHSHQAGWAPQEIGLFVDQHLRGGVALPSISKPSRADDKVQANVTSEANLVAAQLHYTTQSGPNKGREWKSIDANLANNRIVADAPPEETVIWFFTVKDEREAVVSSELVFVSPEANGGR